MRDTKSPHEIDAIVNAGAEAVRKVLYRPKNYRKPPFGDDLSQLYRSASLEMAELAQELTKPVNYSEATMYEAADACAYLFAIITACRDKLGMKVRVNDIDPRPIEPANSCESPEDWAAVAEWEEKRADMAEANGLLLRSVLAVMLEKSKESIYGKMLFMSYEEFAGYHLALTKTGGRP
jgi:hypothetical protein